VWTTPAYDPELGLIIFGIGNPSPVDGRTPPGDNLYTSSLAALDLASGKLRWYYQMVPHNEWDYDPASPPVLLDVPHNGNTVPAVAHAGKTGWVYILDRRNGKLLRRSEPFVPIEHIFPAPTAEGVRTAPGTRGGSNWPSAAYSPETGAVYVLGSHIPMLYKIDSAAVAAAAAKVRRPGSPPPHHLLGVFSEFENDGRFGTFTAVDVATGRIRWQQKVKGPLMLGGALATAGGLVFFPEPAYLNAVDAETGKPLWRYELDKGPVGPPITFMVDGQQRVAVTSTGGVTVFGLR
jgi:glucose dehydrogenase